MNYLVNETTKEERMELVYKALGISMSDAQAPSKETMALVNEYIEGNIELEELQQLVIKMYTNKKEEVE